MKKIVLAMTWLVLSQVCAIAQNPDTQVSGLVLDENGSPLDLANILLLQAIDSSLVKGTISNADGTFVFEKIPFGEYLIACSRVGYTRVYSEGFSLSRNNQILQLEPLSFTDAVNLSEVTVVAEKPLFVKLADRTVINVENSVINAGSDAWEIVQRAPGVAVDNNDQISIMGKSGTIVLLDGKRSYLSGDALAALLQSMPSANIAQVEVITNPSAKYDASGNAGIINIITRKDDKTGYNANFTLNAGIGWNNFINPAVNFNYKGRKFNVFGNYSFADRDRSVILGLVRRIQNENQQVTFNQTKDVFISSEEHNFGLGFDFSFTPKHTISASFRGLRKTDGDEGLSFSTITDVNAVNEELSVRANSAGSLSNYAYSLGYEGKLNKKGTVLSAELNAIDYTILDEELYDVLLIAVDNAVPIHQEALRNQEDSDIDIRTLQLDLVHPFSGSFSMSLGAKYSTVLTSNVLDFAEQINEQWQADPTLSNQFDYDEKVTAGYLNLTKSFGLFTLTGGLRVEHTESLGIPKAGSEPKARRYTDFFPGFSLNYANDELHNLGFSYSRRIDRPRYQDLNPFIFFIDPFTYAIGNPLLQPQYTNNFELSYRANALTFSLGYSNTEDVITFLTIQDDPSLTGTATSENFDNLYNYNGTISYQKPIFKWWQTFSSASLFYNQFKTSLDGASVDNAKVVFRLNTSHSFRLPKGVKLELSGFYQSPTPRGISENEAYYVFNAGVQKQFFQRLNARFSFIDLFNSSRARGHTVFGNQNLNYSFRRLNSRFVLSLSFLIGSEKIKASRSKASGASSEDERVIKN